MMIFVTFNFFRLYWSNVVFLCAISLLNARLAYSQPSKTVGTDSIEYWVSADRGEECPLTKNCITIIDLLNLTASARAHLSVYLYFLPGTYLPNESGFIRFHGEISHYQNSVGSGLYIIGQMNPCHSQACEVVIDCTLSKIAFVVSNVQALEVSQLKTVD